MTDEEARAVEKDYEHKCDFCTWRFKIGRGMMIHRANCVQNYGTTEAAWEIEDIVCRCVWSQGCTMVQIK